MKTYYLKIREKFISEICLGNKKHEFRLATPERLIIKPGDILVLISNQDKNIFVKVSVKKIYTYKNWNDTINAHFDDFKNTFATKDEVLKECDKFYTRDEVRDHGIIAFEIEQIKNKYNDANVLIDTNIIIKRESHNNVSYEVTKLFNWFTKKSISAYIHSASHEELIKYNYEQERNTMITKLNSYSTLPSFSNEEDEYFDNVVSKYPLNKIVK